MLEAIVLFAIVASCLNVEFVNLFLTATLSVTAFTAEERVARVSLACCYGAHKHVPLVDEEEAELLAAAQFQVFYVYTSIVVRFVF